MVSLTKGGVTYKDIEDVGEILRLKSLGYVEEAKKEKKIAKVSKPKKVAVKAKAKDKE